MLSGSVLNVWAHIEPLILSRVGNQRCMQVVRLKPKDGKRIVGSLIPQECVKDVLSALARLQEDPLPAPVDPLPGALAESSASPVSFGSSHFYGSSQ